MIISFLDSEGELLRTGTQQEDDFESDMEQEPEDYEPDFESVNEEFEPYLQTETLNTV